MKTGSFVVYGDIDTLNENIFKGLKEKLLAEEILAGNLAMETAGGVSIRVRVINRILAFDNYKNLFRSEVIYGVK